GPGGRSASPFFPPAGNPLSPGSPDPPARAWDLPRLTQPQPARAVRLQPQALDELWADLGGKGALRAFDALRKLSASPDQAVKLIQDRSSPAMPADADPLAPLLADLGSDRLPL